MGKNMPIATGNDNDALEALDPKTGKFVVLRVPYPMGFFAKSLDGRIDDPKAGWKGKRIVVHLRHARAVAHRRRQGHNQQGREVPVAALIRSRTNGAEAPLGALQVI